MTWEFFSAENPPDVPRGSMDCFVLLVKARDTDRLFTVPAYYLNAYPLDVDDCQCDEEHEDGCPFTGWFDNSSNFDYEDFYTRVTNEIVAYALIPNAEQAQAAMKGPW